MKIWSTFFYIAPTTTETTQGAAYLRIKTPIFSSTRKAFPFSIPFPPCKIKNAGCPAFFRKRKQRGAATGFTPLRHTL